MKKLLLLTFLVSLFMISCTKQSVAEENDVTQLVEAHDKELLKNIDRGEEDESVDLSPAKDEEYEHEEETE